jgi:hypothetical protein
MTEAKRRIYDIANTTEEYMQLAICAVDRQFGMGTSGTRREYIAMFMQTCATLDNGRRQL